MTTLGTFEKRLLDAFQRDFPLTPRPYAAVAETLGVDEDDVIDALGRLRDAGAVSRVGAVVTPHRAGASTLAAIAVPPERLDEVAALVSALPEVNHNYEREHDINLWFVVTAPDRERVAEVLDDIEAQTGLAVLDLPLLEPFCIDLGFPLTWN
jgi:DNA-binding Lrp family transcriptional regulator